MQGDANTGTKRRHDLSSQSLELDMMAWQHSDIFAKHRYMFSDLDMKI